MRLQVFHALRDIQPGEELCHSYTDLCTPTRLRQAALQNKYGFECGCERCRGVEKHDPPKLQPAFAKSLKRFRAPKLQPVSPDAPPTLEPHAPRLVDFCSLALIAAYCSGVRPSGT